MGAFDDLLNMTVGLGPCDHLSYFGRASSNSSGHRAVAPALPEKTDHTFEVDVVAGAWDGRPDRRNEGHRRG